MGLQMGRAESRQSAFALHPTHWLVAGLHTDGAMHRSDDPSAHSTQRPVLVPVVAHTGRSPEQSPALQARHERVVASHTGVAPEQSASVTHPTQTPRESSQRGVAPVQAAASAVVHCTQRPAFVPAVAQTGVAPEQSLALQARHERVDESQMGVAPEQSAPLRHPTHMFEVVSQSDIGA